ncbi:MAG: mandelate racemase/muconate lactonizing enzyme family protein [Anaerolineae bacterium]|nr:mandelate racemase/muconate lactonizing enzyme family protein [Anaerolineae bacterium]
MRIVSLETFLTNAGLRNYCFIRLRTDTGLTGVGEASLEWQERTTETFIHEFCAERYVLGADPFDVESLVLRMVRDQYQGGAVAMTAISGLEIACWDLIGKACGQPVYRLLGGRCHDRLQAYANGWYGGAKTPDDYAERARAVVKAGYRGLKFDPFGVAWKRMSADESKETVAIVEAVRRAVGDDVELMIEFHGRLALDVALEMAHRLAAYHPAWYEEPVAYENLDLLREVKARTAVPIAAGERLYTLADFARLVEMRAADVVQMDVAHCGGILTAKKIAALAEPRDVVLAPHVSVGPVALAAALHLDMCSPNFYRQENFGEHDVPYRDGLVSGWNRFRDGFFTLDETPGLGLELNDAVIAAHPYQPNTFPSLWDRKWIAEFTKRE